MVYNEYEYDEIREIKMSNKRANVGDTIQFTHDNTLVKGIVRKTYDNSVMIEVSQDCIDFLGIKSSLTIINHKRYKLI